MSKPKSDCTLCGGTGLVPNKSVKAPHPPTFDRCTCVLHQDVLQNVERGMFGLSRQPKIETSPLLGFEDKNLWFVMNDDFLKHLRYCMIRKPPTFNFKVVSDAELVTAWLSNIALKGSEILDPDAYMVSTKYLSIPDLVIPPDLLILRMGVKVARNSASAEVLAEALNTRLHEGKTTWIWDDPRQPLNTGHLFWSNDVARSLGHFKKIKGKSSQQAISNKGSTVNPNVRGNRKSLR